MGKLYLSTIKKFCERKTHNTRKRSEQDARAKPEATENASAKHKARMSEAAENVSA